MSSFPTTARRRIPISEANPIVDRLYLTDYSTALDAQELSRLGVTHVVSVLDYDDVDIPESIKHKLHIKIWDDEKADLLQYFDKTTNFIRAALEENKTNVVLVHCLMGVSRSATVVCAYLIATGNMKAAEALAYVESKRPIICPNTGFIQQLEAYAAKHESSRR